MPLARLGEKKYYIGMFFKVAANNLIFYWTPRYGYLLTHSLQANWFKAEQYCRFHGMHLASINSEEEQKNLQDHIQSFGEYNCSFVKTLVSFSCLIIIISITLVLKFGPSIIFHFLQIVWGCASSDSQFYFTISHYCMHCNEQTCAHWWQILLTTPKLSSIEVILNVFEPIDLDDLTT